MRSYLDDPRLSVRAKGLYGLYLHYGRVLSARDMCDRPDVPEGRDAIQTALNELKIAGYIKAVRQHNGRGKFYIYLKFTDEKLNMPFMTEDGFSGDIYIDSNTAITTSTSSNIDTVTNVTVSIGAQAPLEKGEEMGWNLDGEETSPKRFVEEEPAGVVGKVDDRQARLNAKYKPTKVEDKAKHRRDIPEENWGTNELVAEFYELSRTAAPTTPGQGNNKYMATWINKQVSSGTDRYAILKAIRMFFADSRLTRNPGVGKPFYQRFFAYYPTVHGLVVNTEEVEYEDEEFLEHQAKMLKLLEG